MDSAIPSAEQHIADKQSANKGLSTEAGIDDGTRCSNAGACDYSNLWRRRLLPNRVVKWSLTRLQQRLVKTGGRLIRHNPAARRTHPPP